MRTLRCVMAEGWGTAGEKKVLKVWWCSQISTVAFFTTKTLPGRVPVSPVVLSLCCVCVNLVCPTSSFWKSPCGIWPMDVDVCLHPGRTCLFSLPSPPLAFSTEPTWEPGHFPYATQRKKALSVHSTPVTQISSLFASVPAQLCHIRVPLPPLWTKPHKTALGSGHCASFTLGWFSHRPGTVWTVLTLTAPGPLS